MELSDTESQTQPIFTVQSEEIFSDAFTKSSSEQNTLDLEFPKSEDRNVDEEIQASIQRVIEQTSTDDDTQDALLEISLPVSSFQVQEHISSSLILPEMNLGEQLCLIEPVGDVVEKSAFGMIKQIPSVVHHEDKNNSNISETVSDQPDNFSNSLLVGEDVDSKSADQSMLESLDFKEDIEMVIVEEKANEEIKIDIVSTEKMELDEVQEEITGSCSIEPEVSRPMHKLCL